MSRCAVGPIRPSAGFTEARWGGTARTIALAGVLALFCAAGSVSAQETEVESDAQSVARHFNGPRTGREPAFNQRRTQFYPRCAPRLRRKRGRNRVGADFNEDWSIHAFGALFFELGKVSP